MPSCHSLTSYHITSASHHALFESLCLSSPSALFIHFSFPPRPLIVRIDVCVVCSVFLTSYHSRFAQMTCLRLYPFSIIHFIPLHLTLFMSSRVMQRLYSFHLLHHVTSPHVPSSFLLFPLDRLVRINCMC